jgi:L-histidine N-alpha-methyltransferase
MSITINASRSTGTDSASLRQFRADVLRGLRCRPRCLPCKYFYDEAGSALFERITTLPEYYLTRTELAIMQRHAAEMARWLGRRCLLIEYGSGSSTKTRLLLDRMDDAAGYVPIDVAGEHLERSAQALADCYPHIPVHPVHADFTGSLTLPPTDRPAARRVVYFPGSTIGNCTPDETIALLRHTAGLCGADGGLLLGADLRKERAVLEAAYDDRQGVTAAFNRNILVRINRELGADFAVERFAHRAFYNEAQGRIEMHLVSDGAQCVHLGPWRFAIAAGEAIRTEYSYKYNPAELRALASTAGFTSEHTWTDDRGHFSVHAFRVTATKPAS